MAKPDFLPTDQDILHIYIPTKGIYEYTNETNFLIEEIPFNIIGKFKMSYITSSFLSLVKAALEDENQTCTAQRARLSCFGELPDVVWPKIAQKSQN